MFPAYIYTSLYHYLVISLSRSLALSLDRSLSIPFSTNPTLGACDP